MVMAESRQAVAGQMKKAWGWLLAFGVLLILGGTIGLFSTFMVSVVTTIFVGGILFAYGVMEVFQAFKHQGWAGFFLFLVGGLLSIAAGIVLWTRPLAAMEVITLIGAVYFVVQGFFRIMLSVSSRHPGWGWGAVNGAVGVFLGILIWRGWPESGLWVIGMFVCIDMLLAGWNYVMLAIAGRAAARMLASKGH